MDEGGTSFRLVVSAYEYVSYLICVYFLTQITLFYLKYWENLNVSGWNHDKEEENIIDNTK